MTNSTAHELPAGAALPAASGSPERPPTDETAARDRWRRVGLRLGEIAEAAVDKLKDDQDTESPASEFNATIRAISQIVISSQRAMEMEDSYDRKLGNTGGEESAELRRKAREKAEAIERELERQALARRERESGDAKDIQE
ncbi:MAG: hypothetical protein R3C54_14295 [Parvularculaceae bacterium]